MIERVISYHEGGHMELGEPRMDRAMSIRDIFNGLTLRSDKWEPYFDVYEQHLSRFVGTDVGLIEIGVQGGGSLEMWRKWLGDRSRILGIDIDADCARHDTSEFGILIGSQTDKKVWDSATSKIGAVDVIIDDGSHFMQDQIKTFEIAFPSLREGGIYIVEDCHTSYMREYGGSGGDPSTFIEYAKTYVDVLNRTWWEQPNVEGDRRCDIASGLSGLYFHDSMVIFEKGGKKVMTRVFSR